MTFQLHPYVIALFVSAFTSLLTAIFVWRREASGALALAGVLCSAFVWSGACAMSWAGMGLTEKVIWFKVMCLGVSTAPTLFLIFILKITHREN